MSVAEAQVTALCQAVERVDAGDVARYVMLRRLLASGREADRPLFEREYAQYYGLNAARVSRAFRRRYFDLLWTFRMPTSGEPYTRLLEEFYEIPTARGAHALYCSFVAKLVAMHDETRPLYDSHVAGFFGMTVPTRGRLELRIATFVDNLSRIRETYESWRGHPTLGGALGSLRERIPDLAQCHHVRVCDFLVWTAGKEL